MEQNKPRMNRLKKCRSCLRENTLTIFTIIGVVLGMSLGLLIRYTKIREWTKREIIYLAYIGEIYIDILKGLILPLVISSLAAAVGSLDLTLSGTIGGRAVGYYFVTTIMAVVLGSVLVTSIQPGNWFNDKFDENSFRNGPKVVMRNLTITDTLMDLVRLVKYFTCLS